MCAMNSMFEKRRGICTDCTEFGATFLKIALKTVQNHRMSCLCVYSYFINNYICQVMHFV